MWRMVVAIAVAMLVSQPSTGSISGTAVEAQGGVLPGVKVTATWPGGERTAVTDTWGRFTLNDLPVGRFSVTAELAGFETATRDRVTVRSGRTTSISFVLRIGCIVEASYVDFGFAKTRAMADAIATIRISNDRSRACRKTSHCACTQHGAEVVRTLRDPKGLLTRRIQLAQEGAGALSGERPYVAGQEFVAFLRHDAESNIFTRMTGPLYMFPVRDGRVEFKRTDAPRLSDGMPVEAFYQILTREGTGQITGIVTDSADGLIPGTTITLRSAESERTAVTDSRGVFSFDVPPGRYAAVASLRGFYSDPHTDIFVSSGGTVTLKFQMETDCMKASDTVDKGFAWAIKEADVIAHIRIPALDVPGACAIASHCTCTLHHATVLRVMKGQPPRELRLLQEGAGYASVEQPYAPGDEFIAFLRRDDKNHAFIRVTGPLHMFAVRDGRVDLLGRVPPGFADRMTVQEFERALRAVR